MAFSFSFFAPPSTGDLYPEAGVELTGDPLHAQEDFLLLTQSAESHAPLVEPKMPPPITAGLAALAVQQSTAEPLAPPSRKLANYMTPGPAIAASLALAAQATGPVSTSPPPVPPPSAPPSSSHYSTMPGILGRDLAQLRMDLEREIEQVRQDLFGAAMGVSALKDRIDDLEASTTSSPPATPAQAEAPHLSSAEIERLVTAWLNVHLTRHVQEAVQQTLDQALQQTISTLSTCEFFRMPVQYPGISSDHLLSQAPQVISTSQS